MTKLFANDFFARACVGSKRAAFGALGATAFFLFCAHATAAVPLATQRVAQVVDFHDLDLANTQDAKMLYRRLRTAADFVCGQTRRDDMRSRRRNRSCIDNALNDAVAQVNHPALTALHVAKSEMKLAYGKSMQLSRG